jgi:hypothetical protein
MSQPQGKHYPFGEGGDLEMIAGGAESGEAVSVEADEQDHDDASVNSGGPEGLNARADAATSVVSSSSEDDANEDDYDSDSGPPEKQPDALTLRWKRVGDGGGGGGCGGSQGTQEDDSNCDRMGGLRDFVIVVQAKAERDTETDGSHTSNLSSEGQHQGETEYYVHRSVLAYTSQRRSEYFRRRFDGQDGASSEGKITIQLPRLAAMAFPGFLAYVYCDGTNAESFSLETALPLHYLGKKFEIPMLRWDAKSYIQGSISADNWHLYYQQARSLMDRKAQKVALDVCAESLSKVSTSDDMVSVVSPRVWISLLKAKARNPCDRLTVEKVLIRVLQFHTEKIDAGLFRELTDIAVLPAVLCADAAVSLLRAEAAVLPAAAPCDHDLQVEPTCLQKRCVATIAKHVVEDRRYRERINKFFDHHFPTLGTLYREQVIDLLFLNADRASDDRATSAGDILPARVSSALTDARSQEDNCRPSSFPPMR